jgi:hypothetical protein
MTNQFEVFLSHASSDREHVELVRGQIEALGVGVYLAEHDPRPGTSLAGKVDAALQRATLVVVLITSTSIDSQYVQQEVGAAVAHRKPIMPIVDSKIAGKIDLGMLAGVEYLVLDMAQPTQAMRQVTQSLQALVRTHVPEVKSPAVQPTAGFSDSEKLLMVGAIALLVLLLLNETGGGGAAA